MMYFNVEAKTWKPLASTIPSIDSKTCYCAASAGKNLYVAGFKVLFGYRIRRYDTECNVWEKLPHSCGVIKNLCIVDDYMYAISSDYSKFPQRYSFAKCHWQTFTKVSIAKNDSKFNRFYFSGAAVLQSKLYVLYGAYLLLDGWHVQNAGLHCFDPVKNEWEVKATTCKPHFESILFVANNRIHVAGGMTLLKKKMLYGVIQHL